MSLSLSLSRFISSFFVLLYVLVTIWHFYILAHLHRLSRHEVAVIGCLLYACRVLKTEMHLCVSKKKKKKSEVYARPESTNDELIPLSSIQQLHMHTAASLFLLPLLLLHSQVTTIKTFREEQDEK